MAHGVIPDRQDILQNGHTLVVRLTETLVARVVTDCDGPRQGPEWFAREIAVAEHLTRLEAPVIPLHPALPPRPHEHLGFTMSFWQWVTAIPEPPSPAASGCTLAQCHQILASFPEPLPCLAILTESHDLLQTLAKRQLLPAGTLALLDRHLAQSSAALSGFPHQPLHGDAHPGNLLNTTSGLLWTDWEDAFSGPVEWDLASLIWNAQILDNDTATASGILDAWQETARRKPDPAALHHSLIARAAVMSAWYPVLYPNPDTSRQVKLQARLDWLRAQP